MSPTAIGTTVGRRMTETCINCKHFDPDDTALPVCVLHRKFMSDEWSCGDFELHNDEEDE